MKDLITPLGTIRVYADGVSVEYEAVPYECTVRSVRARPPEGCCRLMVSATGRSVIRCLLEPEGDAPPNSGASGERYLYSEFVRGAVVLTIGAGDERQGFQTNRLPLGLEYVLKEPLKEVRFGVAWATDYEGDGDIRTELAADPLYGPEC